MSLNFRAEPRPRWRRRFFSLVGMTMLLASLAAWQRGWRPAQAVADLSSDALTFVPMSVPRVEPLRGRAEASAVVMVNSTVIENPQSKAYFADLYAFTGKDVIPWPNIAGRTRVETYVVQSGDTLWSIAAQYGLDLDTLRWSNPELERNPDVLSVDTELRILPVTGAYHIIGPDDDIEQIAADYGVPVTDIIEYPPNGLFPPYEMHQIEGLIIPYGRKGVTLPVPAPVPEFALAWPLVGTVTGGFAADHPALDIGAPYGSTVYAVDHGTITYATWAQDGYGYTLIVDHGDGRQSWYNHLKGTLLNTGDVVSRGTPIGEVGSTGHSTGPHLHLELHIDGQRVDPGLYLPGIPQ